MARAGVQRLTEMEIQKYSVEAKRKELKNSSRNSNNNSNSNAIPSGGATPDAHELLSSSAYQEEMLKVRAHSYLSELPQYTTTVVRESGSQGRRA